jgi:glycosyltransferase involved in cell wall biosynthesis
LRVIGTGPHLKRLRRLAGPTVKFLGGVSDEELRRQLAGCRALLFPGEEDFGIVPVEAQSFGRPVIAYASGGVLETVRGRFAGEADPLATGVFFREQSCAALQAAMLELESTEGSFDPQVIREHSLRFDRAIFREKMAEFIATALAEFRAGPAA